MSKKTHSFVGTIRIEPRSPEGDDWECDDSTVDLLFASFARRSHLVGDVDFRREPAPRLPTNRLRWPSPLDAAVPIEANLAQLFQNLEAEFGNVPGAIS